MTYPNPEQRQFLDHLHGTLLVLAPAGTGKTRLMADRLAAVIASGLSPELTHVSECGNELTNRAALARNLDFLATDDASIPILTVHQSKGLEFDTVIIAGLAKDEFPSYYAKRDLKLEEQKRLFYVALTRAKRHLILSTCRMNDWGHERTSNAQHRTLK